MKRFFAGLLLLCLSAALLRAADPATLALIEGGHWKRLRALAEPRVKANPNDAEAAYLLAYAKLSFNDVDGAQPLAEKAVALDGNNADYHFLLARVFGQRASKGGISKGLGYAKQFKKENEAALSINPNHIEALLDLMGYYWEAPWIVGGSKKKAEEIAERIGKIDAARGYFAQADLTSREKDKNRSKIESLYRKAFEASPHSYDTHMALANFLVNDPAKKYDEADQLVREALNIDPGKVGAYSLLAVLDVYRERWQDLDAILTQGEKNVPDNLNPYYQAGRVLTTIDKDLPRAERYFRKYLSQEAEAQYPYWSRAHWRLGLVLEKEGHKPEAVSEMEAALKLEPEFEPAKKDLKRLK